MKSIQGWIHLEKKKSLVQVFFNYRLQQDKMWSQKVWILMQSTADPSLSHPGAKSVNPACRINRRFVFIRGQEEYTLAHWRQATMVILQPERRTSRRGIAASVVNINNHIVGLYRESYCWVSQSPHIYTPTGASQRCCILNTAPGSSL